MVKAFVICPNENIGDMMALKFPKNAATWILRKRSTQKRVMMTSLVPLGERS